MTPTILLILLAPAALAVLVYRIEGRVYGRGK
jgi:hypothetical protein